ncbi:Insulin-like domain-containing protein [Strongyloides ratti]|uniref:Insulin-like domain-containing protein n=1 Tax=Strongyloides ratti TaxID=34506 RepID=A0A090L8C5_STRRB|nr:Insulin-like domain-containing protein [Strongyloides ratti]CEF63705.1 Insulin-like domain-containing protein [Strongyloides ratti]
MTYVNSKRYCGNDLTKFISMACGFAGEKTPCLKDNANDVLNNICCKKGCTLNDVKKECCWTKSCLDRCYPGKRYNNGETVIEKLCGNKLQQYMIKACAFANEPKPCMIGDIEKMKNDCCNNGCNMNKIYLYCCFTNQCLKQCYPSKNYTNNEIY